MKGPIAAVLLCLSLLGGCATVPQGTDFPTPTPAAESSTQSIALQPVTVTDKTFVKWNANKTESEGLTLSLLDYLRAKRLFSAVHAPSQPVGRDDHVLNFSFDNFNVHRRPYGGYLPFSLLTLTGYIWFGGTTHIDESNVSGQLQVHDSQGQLVHSYQTRQYGERSISLYSMGPVNGQPERQAALADLLDQYLADLRKQP
ncbi:MAG: hypothetical protein ACRERY_02715 [Pseudomonas sp.]